MSKPYKRQVSLHVAAGLAATWSCLAMHPCVAAAQGSDTDGPGEPVVRLEEVVVSGEPIAPVEGAPSVTVTARDVEDSAAKDIGELLESTVPGVTGQRRGGLNVDPVIRGLRADQINVLVDGTKLWGACPGRMHPPTSLLDVEEVEEVEVVKGPYSVTRGSSGVGGTVDIVTKEPRLNESFTAHASAMSGFASNYDGWTLRGAAWGGGPSAAFRLAAGYRDFQDYESGDGDRIPSGFQSRSLSSRFLWQPTRDDRVRLNFSVDSVRDARFASLPMNAEENDVYLGSLTYTRSSPWPVVENVEVTGYYNYAHHRMNNDGKPNESMMDMSFPLDAHTFGGRVQADLHAPWGGTLALGADAYRVGRDGTSRMLVLAGPQAGNRLRFNVWPDTHIVDGGLFAEGAYPVARRLRLVVGSRIDFVDAGASPDQQGRDAYVRFYGTGADDVDAFETNASANGRLVFSPVETLDVFLGMGRSVRTADATERFYALGPAPGGFRVGNPTLDPEQSLEVDLGAGGRWRKVRIDGSFFHNRITDFILPVVIGRTDVNMDDQPDVVRGFKNIDRATLTGVDLSASYFLTDQLSLLGSLAYVRGENEDDDRPLPEIPPLQGTVGLRFEKAWGESWSGWVIPTVRLVRRQERVDDDFGEDQTPGFSTVDFRAGVRFLERYEIGLSISNLLDKNYNEHLTRENPFTGAEVPEPGRVVSMSLRAEF